MIFSQWRQKRREAKRFAYFRKTVLADVDYLMGFPGDGRFIERLCRQYPSGTAIIEEEFRKDSAVQLAGGRDWEDIPDGPKLRQATQKTVAINLASGIISVELSNLLEQSRRKVSQKLATMTKDHPFTSSLTLTDLGGGHIVQLAGDAIRSLRKNPNKAVDSAVGDKTLSGPELSWLLRVPSDSESALAAMLVSSAFIAHRWALHNLIHVEKSEHKNLGQLLVTMSDLKYSQVL